MEKAKRVFTAEFKREALHLVESSGKPLAEVAWDLGISDNTLHGWKQQAREHGQDAFPGSGHQTPPEEEMRRLRRENEILRQERDILKKRLPSFRNPSDDVSVHRGYPIRLSRLAALQCSWGECEWILRLEAIPASQHAREDGHLKNAVVDAYTASKGRYGSPRVHAELQAQGYRCSRKRIARLMREESLCARRKRRQLRTTRQDPSHQKAENVLDQDFEATAPNQK